MCCFARHVESVSATRIFARSLADNRQALAYGMTVNTPTENAIILPLPVAKGAGEDALKFISLEKYAAFFSDLQSCFVEPQVFSNARAAAGGSIPESQPLKVVGVGSFNASFVPTVKDFSRLDAQFRLPDGVWDRLGQYAAFGFAVFKLRKGSAKVHPMAFTFPTALPGKLFFPTVHIHDGEVHRKAEFDHVLYAQPSPGGLTEKGKWRESDFLPSAKVDLEKAAGLVHPQTHLYRRSMHGMLQNEDVIVGV